ncbi:DsbA family oxidoreductase [Mangrovicoccus algicola]|uniref:DsbA family oxidoreductase n=1 Tax=Mangrovicoccus algicola TaxID=2771008 RepID=A0A8J7CX31_9RHOB|nr:DsbA family oxidoreductase [Mangrovicoccus algicola]MBE3638487.1 DsbA family oxidoreductase [Mangrovicoccus algicola]
MIQLDVISDPICPWCYIGKARLDQALMERPAHPFVIEWHPFQLNPEMPRAGIPRKDYYRNKFGSREAAAEVVSNIMEAAAETGLDFDLSAIPRVPNTLDAHRLILWAGVEGVQPAVVSALFHAYFQDLRDIGDRDVLCDIADGAGLDAAMIRRLLEGESDLKLIVERDAAFRGMGVTGVPTFLVDRKQAVPGAQPADLWVRVIDEIAGVG